MDYLLWNEIPTVIGNLVGGLTFVSATIYSTHYKNGRARNAGMASAAGPKAVAAE